ncbi:hypothetical protein [Acrocarpospora sp. B8E8]|uniref:hypothetical protein n=1 Tax=Acrocarpospora sp. B8E8 TaxID=3153572 RepID=UPI00325CC16A
MSRLADLLPEPEDGTTIVLTGRTICGHMVVRRFDAQGRELGLADDQRWFHLDDHGDPMTWREITTYAHTAYPLGPVLASTETDR